MAEAKERAELAEAAASSLSHEVLTWQGVSKMQEDLTTMVSQQLQTAQSNEAAAKTSLDQALKSHDAAPAAQAEGQGPQTKAKAQKKQAAPDEGLPETGNPVAPCVNC